MLNFFSQHSLIQGDYNLKDIKVIDEIGRGNSHVYTIFIREELYALKQIQIKSDYEYQNFLKQITYMKKISQICQDMIKYFGYFVTLQQINQYTKRKYAHIVMQCAQMNLQNLITCKFDQGKRFSKSEIVKIIDFLVSAFAQLEKNKIAHCDIKPENILVLNKKQFAMKLCDVGSCKIIDSNSVQEATILGTVPFLAPQLVKTKSNKIISSNVFKSDVFSFGLVILYVILFKKFTSKERIQISEQAYFQVISEWIKQARQTIGFDSRITQVLRGALQFEQFKRPLFKDVKTIYEQQKKKKIQAYQAKIKKLQQVENQKRAKLQQNYNSIQTTKISLFKSRNITTKISTRTTSIGFPKISRNYQRTHASPNQFSPGLSPLLSKRQSSCFGSPEKFNNSIIDYKKIIYVTQQDKQSIPFEFLTQQQKNFVFFTCGINIRKADCVSIYPPCSLSIIYQLAQVEANKLYIEYQGFEGVGVGSDCPVLKFKKVFANFKRSEMVGGYKYLFKSLCGNQLQSLQLDITGSDVTFNEVIDLLDRLNNKSLKYLGIIWQDNLMNPQQHSLITQKLSKLSIKKLTLVMNQNYIKYQKQARFLLPKNCQILYLEYHSNFMSKIISNLSISILNNPIKQLYLDFSNNNLNKSESNMLFKSVSSLQYLQKLIINLSWNPIQDISYIITSLNNLKQVSSLQFKLHHTDIPIQQILQAIIQIKYLFDKNLKIFKIGYDRNIKRQTFMEKIEDALDGFKLKIDVLGYDNKYFMAFIKKTNKMVKSKAATTKMKGQKTNLVGFKSIQQQKQIKHKNGYCQSLYSNNCSYDNYMCLGCSQLSQLSKYQYYCKNCIQNCKHKGHNIVKIYQRVKCCCSYSGSCNSDIAKRICAQQVKIKEKKKYYCYKCNRKYCQGCITRCMENHKDWAEQQKQLVSFQCKHQI